jgi:tetratricopeptide (TPR) repeat protein
MFAMMLLSVLLFTTVAGCDEGVKQATLALQQHNAAQAIATLEPLRSACAQSSNVYEVLGLANELSGNKVDAEKALQTAVSIEPESTRLLTELGATLLRNGKPGQASRELDRALLLDGSNIVILKFAVGAAVGSGNWPRAAQLFQQMNVENDNRTLQQEPILVLWLAQMLIETKQSDRLNAFSNNLPDALPPALLFSLGSLFAQHGMYERAVDCLKRVPPKDADDALFFDLGLSYSHLQQFAEARRWYFEAIDRYPGHVEAYLHVGLDYIASGEARMGIPWLYRAQELAPPRPDIAYALGEQLIILDYFNTAKDVLARALESAPHEPLLMVAEGDLKRAQGDSAGAIPLYQRALAEKPGLIPARVSLARADLSVGKDAEAKIQLNRALSEDPQDPMVNGELGLMEAHEGNWNAAEHHLSRSWVQNRSNPQIALELARAYQQNGRLQDALRLLASIAPAMSDSAAFHFQLAQLYTALHRSSEAQNERDTLTKLQALKQDVLHFESPHIYVH